MRSHSGGATMQLILWLTVITAACALSYVTQFSGATLSMGKALSDSGLGRGVQDAITPLWQASVALTVQLSLLIILALTFWAFGWKLGVLAVSVAFVVSIAARRMLPAPDSEHFRHLILR